MNTSLNAENIPQFSTLNEIMAYFDEFVKNEKKNITAEKSFDFLAKISYFFSHAMSGRFTPYFNNKLREEKYNRELVSHKKLITVPKTINNYYEFGKNLKPFCKFSAENDRLAIRNDITLSVDFDNDIVYANVSVVKLIYGKSNKVIDEQDIGVANYCIPNVTTLMRGTAKDLLNNPRKALTFSNQYSDFEKYNEVIEKSAIQTCRVDLDAKHHNNFSAIPNADDNSEILDVAKRVFGEYADAPHLHFLYRDYIVSIKRKDCTKTDSSGLAINLGQLSNYLTELKFAGKQDPIIKYDFGMPFIEIKKKQTKFPYSKIVEITSNFQECLKSLSQVEIKSLNLSLKNEMDNLVKKSEKSSKDSGYIRDILEQTEFVVKAISGSGDELRSRDYQKIDALTLINTEAMILNIIYKMQNNNARLRDKFNGLASDLYRTINTSLNNSLIYDKQRYYYDENQYQTNSFETADELGQPENGN